MVERCIVMRGDRRRNEAERSFALKDAGLVVTGGRWQRRAGYCSVERHNDLLNAAERRRTGRSIKMLSGGWRSWGLHLSDAQLITLPALEARKRSDRIWDARCLSLQSVLLR